MRLILTIALILSFIAIAVFGVLAMNHGQGLAGHGRCIAATAERLDCPGESNPLAFIIFHIDAFKNFSTAVLASSLTGNSPFVFLAFLYFFALTSLVMSVMGKHLLAVPDPSPAGRLRTFEFSSSPLRRQIAHWLALHETSPTSRLRR